MSSDSDIRRERRSWGRYWLPFGGFVKIYGEDGAEGDVPSEARDPRAFGARPRILQALVLIAGIAMNVIFAYILLTAALTSGTPRALDATELAGAKDVQLAVASVLPGSPAATAGLEAGDTITSATDANGTWSSSPSTALGTNSSNLPQTFTDFVAASGGAPMTLVVDREGANLTLRATPALGVVSTEPSREALGVSIAPIGIVPLSFIASLREGALLTWALTKETAVGLAQFFYGILTLHANLSQVSGPVGIAGVVGAAAQTGFGDLLSIAAIISINLALINLIPIPALDGGRLLFVIIESVTRRPIKPSIANTINSISFALLILLMVVVTAHDIYKIV
jgi:regulator of sigma E protease